MRGLSFGQVEEVLARYADIHPDRRAAFVSRLKQWQKQPLQFPEGTNVGKGGRAVYGADQFFQLALLIELLRFGMTPERGIVVIKTMWPEVRVALYDTLVCLAGAATHRHYLNFIVNSLGSLQEPDHPGKLGIWISVNCITENDFKAAYNPPPSLYRWEQWIKDATDESTGEIEKEFAELELAAIEQHTSARDRVLVAHRSTVMLEVDAFIGILLETARVAGIDIGSFTDEIMQWGKEAPKTAWRRFHGPQRNHDDHESAATPQATTEQDLLVASVTRGDTFAVAREALKLPDVYAARQLEPNDRDEEEGFWVENRWSQFQKPSQEAQEAYYQARNERLHPEEHACPGCGEPVTNGE